MSRQEWYNQLYMILSEAELLDADAYKIDIESYKNYSPEDAAEKIRVDIYESDENYSSSYASLYGVIR